MTAPERQAAPGQADLRQRIAQAIGLTRWQAVTDFDGRTVAVDASSATLTAAVLAALQPELDRLRAERDAHAYRVDTLTAVCKSNKRAHRTAVEECDRLTAELAALREQHTATQAENARLRALLARDHAAAYHQGEPRDGLLWHCGRDHCTAPGDPLPLPTEPGNAEDCPQCRELPNPPYPFLCPGHPAVRPST